jgi:hypothetical protein
MCTLLSAFGTSTTDVLVETKNDHTIAVKHETINANLSTAAMSVPGTQEELLPSTDNSFGSLEGAVPPWMSPMHRFTSTELELSSAFPFMSMTPFATFESTLDGIAPSQLVQPVTAFRTFNLKVHPAKLSGTTVRKVASLLQPAQLAHLWNIPFHVLVEDSLLNPIVAQYNYVAPHLVAMMAIDGRLFTHLENIRSVFLLGNNHMIQPFIDLIFDPTLKRDSYLPQILSSQLQQLTTSLPLEDPLAFTVSHVDDKGRLLIDYHVAWPLDIAISASLIQKYNRIFSFLSQVRVAKDALCSNIMFGRVQVSKKRNQPVLPEVLSSKGGLLPLQKRLMLLRWQALSFVNALEDYVMTHCVHRLWQDMIQQLKQCKDLDQLRTVHSTFVDQMSDACLMNPKSKSLLDHTSNVLNMSIKIGTFLKRVRSAGDTANLTDADVLPLESDMTKSIRFVLEVLERVSKMKDSLSTLHALLLRVDWNWFYQTTFRGLSK